METQGFKLKPLKGLAILISLVFHPLWWPSLGLYILLVLNPYLFGVNSPGGRSTLLLQVFVLTFILPIVSMIIMKRLALISSIQLKDRMDRIGPYIVTMIFYFWLYLSIRRDAAVPLVYNIFIFGGLIALCMIFMINLFIKISAHTAVMGGLLAMTWITFNVFSHETIAVELPGHGLTTWPWKTALIWVIVIAGIVGTSRIYLGAHTLKEIYFGYLLGFVSQWVAFKILF